MKERSTKWVTCAPPATKEPWKARTASCLPLLISHPPAPRPPRAFLSRPFAVPVRAAASHPRSKRVSLLQPTTTPRCRCPLGSSFTPCKSAQQTVPPCDLRVLCLYHHHARSHHRTLTWPPTRLTSPLVASWLPAPLTHRLVGKSLTDR